MRLHGAAGVFKNLDGAVDAVFAGNDGDEPAGCRDSGLRTALSEARRGRIRVDERTGVAGVPAPLGHAVDAAGKRVVQAVRPVACVAADFIQLHRVVSFLPEQRTSQLGLFAAREIGEYAASYQRPHPFRLRRRDDVGKAERAAVGIVPAAESADSS